jgi:hypothetical protein
MPCTSLRDLTVLVTRIFLHILKAPNDYNSALHIAAVLVLLRAGMLASVQRYDGAATFSRDSMIFITEIHHKNTTTDLLQKTTDLLTEGQKTSSSQHEVTQSNRVVEYRRQNCSRVGDFSLQPPRLYAIYHGRLSRSEFHDGQVPLKASGSCS